MSSRSAFVALAALGVACGPNDRQLAYHEQEPPAEVEPPQSATIDTDGAVHAEDEVGFVAAVVEYEQGGDWFVGVTCDTAVSGYGCGWDVIVESIDGDPIFRIVDNDLEASDLVLVDLSALRLVTYTTDDVDGVSFRLSAGAGIRVDVFLDGRPHPEFLEWVGDGALHLGAPTNPFELAPAMP